MRLRTTLLALFIFSFAFSSLAYADDIDSRLKAMEDTLKGQQEQIQEQQKVINELKEELSANQGRARGDTGGEYSHVYTGNRSARSGSA